MKAITWKIYSQNNDIYLVRQTEDVTKIQTR